MCRPTLILLLLIRLSLFEKLIEKVYIRLMNLSKILAGSLHGWEIVLLHDLHDMGSVFLPSQTQLQFNSAREIRVIQTVLDSQFRRTGDRRRSGIAGFASLGDDVYFDVTVSQCVPAGGCLPCNLESIILERLQ